MSLVYRALLCLALLGSAFGAGWLKSTQWHKAKALKAQLAQEQATRVLEAQAARNMQRTSDVLTQNRIATERRAADLADRLRLAADAVPAVPGCPSRNEDTRAPVAVLSDGVRADLARLAKEADAAADQLRAYQAVKE